MAMLADGGGAALQRNSSLPWPVSTRTYPQSVFSALPGANDSVRVAVAETLFRWGACGRTGSLHRLAQAASSEQSPEHTLVGRSGSSCAPAALYIKQDRSTSYWPAGPS